MTTKSITHTQRANFCVSKLRLDIASVTMLPINAWREAATNFTDTRSPLELFGVAVAVSSVAYALWFFCSLAARRSPFARGPRWHWFVGSTVEFVTNFPRINEWVLDCTEKYGKFKQTWGFTMLSAGVFAKGFLCLVTPEDVRHVLKGNFEGYEKGVLATPFTDFIGSSIFTTDGPVWKFHRKVASHMFSRKLLIDGTEVAFNQAKKFIAMLDDKARTGESVDVQPAFFAFTMDTFCIIAFGMDFKSSHTSQSEFANAFDRVQQLATLRLGNAAWPIQRFLGIGAEKELAEKIGITAKFANEIIENKRRRVQSSNEPLGVDLVTRFLERAKANGEYLSTQDLRDIVLSFLLAGRDTTASALSWSIYEVCRRPEIADIIRSELAQHVPAKKSLLELPYEEAFHILSTGLVETKAVVMEVLRLHPSVAFDMKLARKDDVLPSGTKVPKGCAVVYAPYAMGRNPEIWPEPEKFDHTRFLSSVRDEPSSKNGRKKRISVYRPTSVSDYKYPVFNAGPRLCLGRPLAVLEIQLMLCALVERYDFKPSKPHTSKIKLAPVASNADGVPVYVTRRPR